MSEEVTFDQFRPAIETLTLFASTLPPPVALAVVRTVITHMASATPSPNADDAIVNAFEVFRVLHTHTSKHPDPELPAGWKGTVSWCAVRARDARGRRGPPAHDRRQRREERQRAVAEGGRLRERAR